MMWRALALGATLGFVAAVVPSCGADPTPRCVRSNCPGCCDADGVCQLGSTAQACGLEALTCQACETGSECVEGTCRVSGVDGGSDAGVCGPGNCPGCCVGGVCKPGNTTLACGANGSACLGCSGTQSCQSGICSNTGCPGCRDVSGNCQSGQSNNSCGTGGGMCSACTQGQQCVGGMCQGGACTASTCPNGCCNGNTCVTPPTPAQCGKGGSTCTACTGTQACVEDGTCWSDAGTPGGGGDGGFDLLDGGFPSLCDPPCTAGCCDLLTQVCKAGTDLWACGNGGGLCTICDIFSGKMCTAAGTCQ